ncbi:metal-dependent hydrolase family protein [Lichenibacterium ramalinae]|jgi:imidazolonepropionase-like amidohydrolase|uniref:Amidohydrolase family protein n=1 Tax=Lichenibacterium ramalinae TaxID=2316527 RepID=A0A4Q2RD10_9HYPH|nr:amidohydrolase family protein [Lichenibacterium ramalinae]RYB04154.1 amidohydrolase family protein [Lichenibacterium ramalinae]
MQTLFLNAAITDATRAEPRMGNVLVEDGIIRDVDARSTGGDREVIDLGGRTLMPGLVDSHVHVVASTMDLTTNAQLPDALAILRSLPIMRGMLDRGFTTVRDVGGAPPALSDAIAEGLVPAPRVVACGKALSKTGGHADNRPRHDTHDATRWGRNYGALGRVADGVDEVRRACRQELRQGARFIKVMANGGVSSPTDPIAWQGYSASELTAIVEEARDAQTYVSAHLYTADAIQRALACGVHSLEHCNNIDAASARLAAERGAVAVPTLVTYEALAEDGERLGLPPASIAKIEAVRANGLGSLSILRDAGVTMAYGTDLLGEAHVRQNQEFAIRARALPSAEIFASATTVGAELCHLAGQIGVVAPGACADLLVVEGQPLTDIAVLADPRRNILLVMKGGHVHRRHTV